MGTYFEKVLDLLNKKPALIIWISCIEKGRNLSELTRMWETDPRKRFLYGGYSKKLEDLNLVEERAEKVDTGKGERLATVCYSKLDWLAKYIMYLIKNYKESEFVSTLNEVFDVFNIDEDSVLEILDSDAFRKGCMNLDLLLREIKFAKAIYETSEYYEKERKKMENPNDILTFIGDVLSLPEMPEEIKKNGASEKITEIFENAKKEPWKHKFSFRTIIFGRLQLLSLFKAFQEDDRCLNYWKSGHVHIPAIFSIGVIPAEKSYEFFMNENYKISEKVKSFFTIKQVAREQVSSLIFIKSEWPDIWDEIKKELNLKEEK